MKHLILSMVIIAGMALTGGLMAAEKDAGKGKGAEKSKTAEKGKKEVKPELGKPIPFQGTIVAVTSRTLTLKGAEGKPDRKFTLNKDTVIKVGDEIKTAEALKVGAAVSGSFMEKAEGGNVVHTVQVK
jgi:hypothetical protein